MRKFGNKFSRMVLAALLSGSMILSSVAVPQVGFAATSNPEISQREKDHAALAREVAAQGMVLLENEHNALPLTGKTVALFGGGAARSVRGGTGSGDPFNGGLSGGGDLNVNQNERYNINIYKSFLDAGYTVTTKDMLDDYAKRYDEKYNGGVMSTFYFPEDAYTDAQVKAAAEGCDTAIYVVSRNAGEGNDRVLTGTSEIEGIGKFEYGDYELTDVEKENIRKVTEAFDKSIVVLNVGGVMDTNYFSSLKKLDSLLLMGQAGQESGNALLDVVSGKVTPSGKTIDTWAKEYADYPASATFAMNDKNQVYEEYKEGIYVGYRYFDTFGIEPKYEFGYGKSYTNFDIDVTDVKVSEEKIEVSAEVTNTGSKYSGKEVVEVYFSAPDSANAEKAYQELAGFAKTDELAPGKKQTLTISFDPKDMAYYNETKAAYVLDKGDYLIRVGNSSRNTEVVAKVTMPEEKITEQVSNVFPLPEGTEFEEISKKNAKPYTYAEEKAEIAAAKTFTLDAGKITTTTIENPYDNNEVTTYTTDASYQATLDYEKVQVVDKKDVTLKDVYDGTATMGELVAQMSLEELAALNCGSGWGVANENSPIIGANSSTVPGAAGETTKYEQYKIPNTVLADGPGGIRVKQHYEATNEQGEKVAQYQYCTAWPVSFVLAQTWDLDLVERIGDAFGKELEEMNITLLLGPSLNIHRDPLCGRNFEYFSEDPFISGKMAAAVTKGVQKTPGVGACLKHYAGNNQETNRNSSDTRVHERAFREIYLEGFKIAIKEAQPMSMMTAYNKINGIPAGHNFDLCNKLTRGEWGFEGLIMTDWNGGESEADLSMWAGNDLIMPGGAAKANLIIGGVTDLAPDFDERGQVVVGKDLLFGSIPLDKVMWNEFTVKADGTKTVVAKLGEGHTATVSEGKILVDGEAVYYNTKEELLWFTFPYTTLDKDTPLTTEFATVSDDGKTITYKGEYVDNNRICLGDVQRAAINNLNIIVKSKDMERIYGTEAVPYTASFDNLVNNMTVTKSDITDGEIVPDRSFTEVIEGFDWGPGVTKAIVDLDETLDTSKFTKANTTVTVTTLNPFFAWGMGEEYSTTPRTITNVYACDANGNKVADTKSQYVAIEMAVSPEEGNPFTYSFTTQLNTWTDPYDCEIKLGDITVNKIFNRVMPVADQFKKYVSTYSQENADDIKLSYGVFSPKADNKKNALVIWLHGAGEGGTDDDIALLGNNVTNLAEDEIQNIFDGAYVLSPQTPTVWMDATGTGAYGTEGTSYYTKALFNLIDTYVKGNSDIDTDRIYIGGCSNGGFMTMNMIKNYPDYFAAAFPICEAYPNEFLTDEDINNIKNLPIWFTHAKNDPTVIISKGKKDGYNFVFDKDADGNYILDENAFTVAAYNRLKAAGAKNVHFSLFEDVHDTSGLYKGQDGKEYQYNGHWSWIYTLNNECTKDFDGSNVKVAGKDVTIMEWLAAQKKGAATEEPGTDNPGTDNPGTDNPGGSNTPDPSDPGNGGNTNVTVPSTDETKPETKPEASAPSATVVTVTEKDGAFVNAAGEKVTNAIVKAEDGKNYILDAQGAKIKNAVVKTASGTKFVTAKDGAVVKGKVVTVNGKKFYTTKATGKVVTGKAFKVNGKKYIAAKSGALYVSKWVTIGNKKYYCNKNGVVTKTKKIK